MQASEYMYLILKALRRNQKRWDRCHCPACAQCKESSERKVDEMIAEIDAAMKAKGIPVPEPELRDCQ